MSLGSLLIYDSGLFPYFATRMAEGFETVWYFSPWHSAFPLSRATLPGQGLPGVERVNDFWDHVSEADTIAFPDVGMGDLQMWLREQGKSVWGSGYAQALELDRARFVRLMQATGKERRDGDVVVRGLDGLRMTLEKWDGDAYVKLSEWRGDMETFHHLDWWRSQPRLEKLAQHVGPMADALEFVVETPVDGVETGYDGYCIDGAFPRMGFWGYEEKDLAYVIQSSQRLPGIVQEKNDLLAPLLEKLGCRSAVSTEIRVSSDGTGILIDPTMRLGSPPSEVMMEMIGNWPEIVHAGARGDLIEPQILHPYGAELLLRSAWAKTDFLALRFPKRYRQFIKLHGHCAFDTSDYVAISHMDLDVIGAAIGVGEDIDAAMAMAEDVAGSIEGQDIEVPQGAFDALRDRMSEGEEYGLQWG